MDSFEFNKIAGAVLAVLLFTVGMGQFAGAVFSPKMPKTPGWALPAEEEPKAGGDKVAAAVPLPELLAKADAKKGEAVAKDCLSCHAFEKGGANKSGPALYGVVGRPMAAAQGFPYSNAFKEYAAVHKTWSFEELDKFLTNPKAAVKGTAMNYGGVGNAAKRADLIAYLRSRADTPVDLPK